MTTDEKNKIEEDDILEQMEDEIEEVENEEWGIDEKKLEEFINPEDEKCKDILARTMADFENYKKRVERDKNDMIFFLKSDILKKVLPRLDDLERIIKNTPDELKDNPLYEGVVSMQTKLISDLDKMDVKSFNAIWETVNPDKHDVMTTVPWQEAWIIFDEFERWYLLWDKVLRHSKVVVGA